MLLKGGPNICGATIGVLCLDSRFPKPVGHIKNPSSFKFPILYETVKGATVQNILDNPDSEFIEPFISAAKNLESNGVRAITSSCGFFALFQNELANAVNIPVFSSSLIQVPMIYNLFGQTGHIGILTACKSKLTNNHFKAVGADKVPVSINGMDNSNEFREVILEGIRDDMDICKVESEILECAKVLVSQQPDVKALVLECTDMSPYSYKLQDNLRLPIFDITTLTNMIHDVICRTQYFGINPTGIWRK